MLHTSNLPYQRNNNLMMHNLLVLAVDISNDRTMLGTMSSNRTVCVWKRLTGKLLQKLERVHGGIVGSLGDGKKAECCGSAAQWNCSISLQTHACALHRILAQWDQDNDGGTQFDVPRVGTACLANILKEFCGHKSYVNCYGYVILPPSVLGTSDGRGGVNGRSCQDGGGGRICLSLAPMG
jgi:hypothetical protein